MRRFLVRRARALALFSAVLSQSAQGAGPVRAADLRGLDERIAELEQTVPLAGNRRIQLNLYGQVDRALLFWNDGFDSGTYGVDNHTSSSRFGFVGQTILGPGWTAGYRLEIETPFPSSDEVFNGPGGASAGLADTVRIRQNYWDITAKDLGRVALGFQSPATDDITLINLGSQINDAAVHFNSAFNIRLDLLSPPIVTGLTWGQIAHNVDSFRGNFVRYDTPVLAGVMLSTAWNNDVWDAALRYQKGSGGFRFAGGAGYMRDDAFRFEDVRGSASLIHDATGLYASGAGGWRNAAQTVPVNGDDAWFYYAQLGISRQWFSPGKTTFYVDRGLYRNFNVGEILSINPDTKDEVAWGTLVDTEVHRWGFGVEQAVDSANLLLYAQAHFYDPTLVGFPCTFDPDPKNPGKTVCGGDPSQTTKLPAASWQGFVVGARIQF
ncbi:MAG TPA: porin [Hyphomicrobiaceae bacterium]|jgi:predicted porin